MAVSTSDGVIQNEATGMVLAFEGGLIQADREDGKATQQWQLVPVAGVTDVYHLKNLGSDNFLAAGPGGVLQEVPGTTGAWAEQWQAKLVPGRTDTYYLVNRNWDTQPLSAIPPGGDGYPGVILYADMGQPNQWWKLPSDLPQPPRPPLIASGQTAPGVGWQQSAAISVYLDVDTSSAGFSSTPVYVISLGGTGGNMYQTTGGASSVYNPTPTGFRVSLMWRDGTNLPVSDVTDGYKWYVNWIGIQN